VADSGDSTGVSKLGLKSGGSLDKMRILFLNPMLASAGVGAERPSGAGGEARALATATRAAEDLLNDEPEPPHDQRTSMRGLPIQRESRP
jgi:hypothetical protein